MNKRVTNSRVANICYLERYYCLTHSPPAHEKIPLSLSLSWPVCVLYGRMCLWMCKKLNF